MTLYDDSRVVTLLREIDPPLAPPNRLSAVTRRARRGESQRASALAGVMALVLAGGVLAAVNLGGRANTETLSVAGAASATRDAGSARVSLRFTVLKSDQPLLPAGDLMSLSGPADFRHSTFSLTGTFQKTRIEMRGIGKDRWTKYTDPSIPAAFADPTKPWIHSVDSETGTSDFKDADPERLLDALTSKGTVLSTQADGDRTVTIVRLSASAWKSAFGSMSDSPSADASITTDSDGRIREVTSDTTTKGLGTTRVTMRYDDFGIKVDVQPPPSDQVREAPASTGSTSGSFSVTTSGGGSSSPADAKKACEQFKVFQKGRPAPTTEQERQQQKQFDDIEKQVCAKQ